MRHASDCRRFCSLSCISGRVFLQYVDTTGLYEPRADQRHITRSLVHAYLQDAALRGFSWVHVHAHWSPSYLFSGSDSIPAKLSSGSSSDRRLLAWWSRTIASSAAVRGGSLIVPGLGPTDRAVEAYVLFVSTWPLTQHSALTALGTTWSHGHPFPAGRALLSRLPCFALDDEKSRAVAKFGRDVADLSAVLDALASQAHLSAFFWARIGEESGAAKAVAAVNEGGKELEEFRFGSRDEAERLTEEYLKGVEEGKAVVEAAGNGEKEKEAKKEEKQVEKQPAVNNLQGLIRKKPRTT